MITKQVCTVSKNIHGAWIVSSIVDGYRVQRVYYYYTRQAAIREFLDELNRKAGTR